MRTIKLFHNKVILLMVTLLVLLLSVAYTERVLGSESLVLKKKVAIARFTNETKSGNSFLISKDEDKIGKQASDILSTRLVDTDRFIVFERIDSNKITTEQLLSNMKEEGVAVDYLIIGSVSEFGRSTSSDTGMFSQKKKQTAFAKVNVRLIEVSTGRIIHAEEGAGEASSETKKTMGVGSSAGYDQSLTDKSISVAISQVISNLVENMSSKPWRSYVLADDDGEYIIAGGEAQGLRVGTVLYVYKSGRVVDNPQTGAQVILPGRKVATVSVIQSFGDEFNEVSFVDVVNGAIGTDLTKYYIEAE
jgi:curli biogenesis system outer membrane secretion channel CsgG